MAVAKVAARAANESFMVEVEGVGIEYPRNYDQMEVYAFLVKR